MQPCLRPRLGRLPGAYRAQYRSAELCRCCRHALGDGGSVITAVIPVLELGGRRRTVVSAFRAGRMGCLRWPIWARTDR